MCALVIRLCEKNFRKKLNFGITSFCEQLLKRERAVAPSHQNETNRSKGIRVKERKQKEWNVLWMLLNKIVGQFEENIGMFGKEMKSITTGKTQKIVCVNKVKETVSAQKKELCEKEEQYIESLLFVREACNEDKSIRKH